jgi:hypothetical protein
MPRLNPYAPGRYTIRFPKYPDFTDLRIEDASPGAIEDEADMSDRQVVDYLRKRALKDVVITDHTSGSVFRKKASLKDFVFNTDLDRKNNPRRRGGSPTPAQRNAAKAMRLYHSGQADSLAEAWAIVKRRA